MICEEFGGKDLSPATCAATKRNGWCDRSCEQKPLPKNGNGGNVKSPQNNPIAIDQPSQISTNTPKEAQSTDESTKTIVGHPAKSKAEIVGKCEKTGDELTWSGCRQRKTKSNIDVCKACDQKAFRFYEKPMGRGWANSASRAIEIDCPDLGRKVKLPSCRMKQGRLVKAGKTCDVTCQFWEGEKIVAEQKTTIYWCFRCGSKEVEALGNICPRCQDAVNRDKEFESLTYLCPTLDCDNQVKVEGMLCGDCQIEGLKKVEGPNINPVKPNHIKLVGISESLQKKLEAHHQAVEDIKHWTDLLKNLESEIVAELQKAVKEVEGGN